MKQLLSLLLCLCLLVNTVAPSFAQGLLASGTKEGVVALFSAGIKDAALNRALMQQMIREGIETGLYRETVASVNKIHTQFASGELAGLGEEILVLPDDRVRAWMMRNEMVVLSLNHSLAPQTLSKTLITYQYNLKEARAIFQTIPASETLTSFVRKAEKASAEAPSQKVLAVLADASALALIGTEKDVPALLAFYEDARGTIFQELAGVIVGRGLLRYQAYEALNTFVSKEKVRGFFWTEMSSFVRQHQLPVTIPLAAPYTEEVLRVAGPLTAYLKQAGPLLAIQGDLSAAATDTWVSLGKQPVQLTHRTAGPAAPKKTIFAGQPATAATGANPAPTQAVSARQAIPTSAEMPTSQTAIRQTAAPAQEGAPYTHPSLQTASMPHMPLLGVVSYPSSVAEGNPLAAASTGRKAQAVREPEGLHDNNVHELYEEISPMPAYEAEDFSTEEALPAFVPIAGEGFKFTVEHKGEETILENVNVSISSGIKLAYGYNRLVQTEDHIFELRNQTLDPKKMERFFFALSMENDALKTLIEGADELRSYYPLRIKINRENSDVSFLTQFLGSLKRVFGQKTVVQIPLHVGSQRGAFVLADLDVSLLPSALAKTAQEGYLVLQGKRIFYYAPDGTRQVLSHFYVRLPKEESSKWARILQNNPQTSFKLNVYPTENKTAFITYGVSQLRVGTGKIFGPIMSFLGLPMWASTGIPLFANNGMSLVLGPLMPLLRRIGEANMFRLGVGLYALSSLSALALGFNGFLGIENATLGQLVGFVGVLFGMGIAGTLVNTVNNNLLASNAGLITAPRAKGSKKSAVVRDPAQAPTVSYLGKRIKEIFTARNVPMRNSVMYQLASAMKNVTTFLFASWPFLFNLVSEAVGSSVRADFSLSFWFLAGASIYSLIRVLRMPLKDSFPRDMSVLHKMATEKEAQVIGELEHQLLTQPQTTPDFTRLVQQLNSILGPYARETSYVMKEKTAEVSNQLEAETINNIREELIKKGFPAETVEQTAQGLRQAFDALGRRNVNMRDVLKKPLVFSSLLAMTLLTVHELGTSSEFAFAVNDSLKQAGMDPKASIALGTFLSALFLYAPSFFFRLAGNWLALRMSEGSMYAFSSAASVIGTALMIASHGHLPMLFTGAIFATFGMGNFFSQVYEYIMSLQPKHRTELAVWVGYTMPIAAALTAGIRELASWGLDHGIYGLGLMVCGAALVGSFFASPGMFAGSSLIKSIRYYTDKLTQLLKKGDQPASDVAATPAP